MGSGSAKADRLRIYLLFTEGAGDGAATEFFSAGRSLLKLARLSKTELKSFFFLTKIVLFTDT